MLPYFEADYFSLLGFPRKLNLDSTALKNNFYLLSKKFHPDRHRSSPEQEREIAVQKSILLNKAYETLKDKSQRIRYLIDVELGLTPQDREITMNVPKDLFALVEKVNKMVIAAKEHIRMERGSVEDLRAPMQSQIEQMQEEIKIREQCLDDLARQWDSGIDSNDAGQIDRDRRITLLGELKKKMQELAFCEKMVVRLNRVFEEEFYREV